jgi:hypothetical protein
LDLAKQFACALRFKEVSSERGGFQGFKILQRRDLQGSNFLLRHERYRVFLQKFKKRRVSAVEQGGCWGVYIHVSIVFGFA